MPELITKHPDVTKKVLESAGAKCGKGLPQKILVRCPKDQFCSLPGGELCIYGVDQIEQMTQLSRDEICAETGHVSASVIEWSGILVTLALLATLARRHL